MKAIEVYRDDLCYATVNDRSATLGHIRVYPHSQLDTLEEIKSNDIAHLFHVASVCASILFEGLKAQGTNIICNNKKDKNPACIEILARSENDGLGMIWEPKQGNPGEIAALAKKIKDTIVPVDTEPIKPIEEKEPEKIKHEEKENSMIEQLRRIP